MNAFFSDIKAFRRTLRSQEDPGDHCWSCSSRDPPLVGFTVHEDFNASFRRVPIRGWQVLTLASS
jgi:hypothetical protein